MAQVVDVVTGDQLRPGMMVSRVGMPGKPVIERVQPINRVSPKCRHGFHFGNGCYDFIGSWLVWEGAKDHA